MGFLDGGVSEMFSGMFSGFYLDASLYRPATFTDDGAGGGDESDDAFGDPEAVKVQPEATTQAMRDTPGYVDTDRRFLMLAHGVDEPTTDCELEFDSARWSIQSIGRDPASTYYDLHTRFRNAAS